MYQPQPEQKGLKTIVRTDFHKTFPSSSQTLNANIQLNKANQERTIKVPDFTVTSNYVSIITVRLKSSTDTGDNNNGNDNEHLFNPKSTFIVEIEKTYVGIHNTNVDVE